MPSPRPEPAIAAGRRVGRYEILLDQGDDGLVARSVARVHGPNAGPAIVELARVAPSMASAVEVRAAFLAEARVASRVRHPSFVHPTDSLLHHGELYGAVELNVGARLEELAIAARRVSRTVPVGVAIRIVLDVLAGLSALHASSAALGLSGPVHGDVVPASVVIGPRGVARIVHSGLASAVLRAGVTGRHGGRLAYKAPEQLRTGTTVRPTATTDVFAVGVLLWECLAGERLFAAAGELAVVERVLSLAIPFSPIEARVRPTLTAALGTALERVPERRFPSATHFAEALTRSAGSTIASPEDVASFVEEVLGSDLAERRRSIEAVVTADADALNGAASSGLSSYVRRAGSLRTPVGIVHRPADVPPSSERIRAARGWSSSGQLAAFARATPLVPSTAPPSARARLELEAAGARRVVEPRRVARPGGRDDARGLLLIATALLIALAGVLAYAIQRSATPSSATPAQQVVDVPLR